MNKLRPILKWAGGKYRCLEHILSALPQHTRLIEPFAGSCVVTLNASFEEFLIADNNPDLISLYQYIQEDGQQFIQECEPYFNLKNNCAEQYYQIRHLFNQSTDPKLRAVLFLYLNRHGYNGLCRYNLKGKYNVPFGRYKKPYFPKNELNQFCQKIKNATIITADFTETFSHAKLGDVIYCDPPYAPINQLTNFTAYSEKRFGETEQLLLADLAIETANRGIPVIISNHDTPFTRRCYQSSYITSFPVRRTINRNAKSRLPVYELIAVFQ